ncbi:DUF262 domain-containing protein [Actinokineospora globicatena]|uniref:GmrSD restriction endonucleases N-terminal domain-containing protein n=1 Tax=Actinokineospora globicatena TaxID=103729 RepID=A0A9W6V645_9PSEU|nr:DUF262 domain-containing protein [Actinokineospora globicatena]GLW91145.1 hypothetical protein Aglo03_19610 [Actinokineospora globicatena]
MNLAEQVESNRQNIRSDGYQMSIGEVVNLYRDREIIIRPEFQRLFRWTIEQQSRLIESVLLDIPLPTIFVSQRQDSVWEVVDGLQRLSTILKFMGEYRDAESGEIEPQTVLRKTKYLPDLEGTTYSDGEKTLPGVLKLAFKRARLEFRIILKESDDSVRYEVFDRLNSGGTQTSPQEVRTAQLLMANPEFAGWLDSLRRSSSFQSCIPLTDRQIAEQYDFALATRFLVFNLSTNAQLKSFADVDTFLTEQSLLFANKKDFSYVDQRAVFDGVFDVLASLGPEVFRRLDKTRDRLSGAFTVSAFEAITLGVASHLNDWQKLTANDQARELRLRIGKLWKDSVFSKNSGAGVRATTRAPRMRPIGERIFKLG